MKTQEIERELSVLEEKHAACLWWMNELSSIGATEQDKSIRNLKDTADETQMKISDLKNKLRNRKPQSMRERTMTCFSFLTKPKRESS